MQHLKPARGSHQLLLSKPSRPVWGLHIQNP